MKANKETLHAMNTAGGNIHRRFKGEFWYFGWLIKRALTRLITPFTKIWA